MIQSDHQNHFPEIEVLQNTCPIVISYHVARSLFHWIRIYQILLLRSNIHKLITKTILRIDTIKEISCKTFNV